MAHTISWFGPAFLTGFNEEIDFNSDSFKVMLADATYAPNIDTHNYKDDVTNELSGGGYVAGGTALVSPTWVLTAGTNTVALDAVDTQWTGLSVTNLKYGVVYDDTPATDAAKPLIALITFDANQTFTNATFSLNWNVAGIVTVVYS